MSIIDLPTPRSDSETTASAAPKPSLWIVALAVVAMGSVLYGSLMPFDFASPEPPANLTIFQAASVDDLVTNLLIYLPIGLLLRLSWMRSRISNTAQVVLSLMPVAGLSLVAEAAQCWLPSRVTSLTDFGLNVAAGTVAVIAAPFVYRTVYRIARHLGRQTVAKPMSVAAKVTTLLIFVVWLVPFDFVTTTEALHDSFRQAHWVPGVRIMDSTTLDPFAKFIGACGGFAAFAVLGYFAGLSRREDGRDRIGSLVYGVVQVVAIAGMIELIQLFIGSRNLDVNTALIHSLGGLLGVWAALILVDLPSQGLWREQPGSTLPQFLLIPALIMQMVYLSATQLSPFDLHRAAIDVSNMSWYPFVAYFHRPWLNALGAMVPTVIQYAVMALTCAAVFNSDRSWLRGLQAVLLITLLAALLTVLQTSVPARHADVTDVILAAAACTAVIALYRWFGSFVRPAVVPVQAK